MTKDPWTDPDPQPGDFDAELAKLDESAFEYHEGNPAAKLRMLVSVEGEDLARLERIAQARGTQPSAVLTDRARSLASRSCSSNWWAVDVWPRSRAA